MVRKVRLFRTYFLDADPVTSYLNYIENLPLMDDVEAFSLHQNANVIFQRKESKEYLDALLSMEPMTLADSNENAHEVTG